MEKTLQEKVFQKFALSVIGIWHNQSNDEIITFHLLSFATQAGEIVITKNKRVDLGIYRLVFFPDNEVFLKIETAANVYSVQLKLLSDDTLVLYKHNKIHHVYKRDIDIAFADEVIKSL